MHATITTREEACSLVLNGLDSLRKGLILYHELGLTTKEIYADLKAAGWDKSLRTLQSHQTELRKEGLLPPGRGGGAHTHKPRVAESCNSPVENSSTQAQANHHSHSFDDQRCYTKPSISSPVPVVQPIVETYTVEPEERVVSMGTAAERDWQQAVEHLKALRQFTHDYFDPQGPITEQQWEQFHAECHDLAYFASSRFQNLRKENERTARAIIGAVFTDGDSSV